MRHAVYTFCSDLSRDPVAAHVLRALERAVPLESIETVVDERPVRRTMLNASTMLSIVETADVISHDYSRYAPMLNAFTDADVVGVVNWHEGANAPNAIFTVQTTGDMTSGAFSPVDPKITRSLLMAIEDERVAAGLDTFQTFAEATHWSGIMHGSAGTRLADVNASVIDIEIGSSPADWTNPSAAQVVARALLRVFEKADEPARSFLCLGGIHFEPNFTRFVLDQREGTPFAVSHILPNHWLVSNGYDQEARLADLSACVRSIKGGIDGIVHHASLKAAYKEKARQLAALHQVPLFTHKALRAPNAS